MSSENVQNEVGDLYRLVEELLKMGKKIVEQMKGVGKEVGQCRQRGKEMMAEVPGSGLVVDLIMAFYVFVALVLMWWWSRRVVVNILDSLGSGFSGLKREIREKGRNKSRSLPTVSPLVLPGGGLINQNWQPLPGRQSLVKSPVVEKENRNPFRQPLPVSTKSVVTTEAVVHAGGGAAEAVAPAGVGGAEAVVPAGVGAAEAIVPAGGGAAEAIVPAGGGAKKPSVNLYENIRESPMKPCQSVPILPTEGGYDEFSSDEDGNYTSMTYISPMSLRSGKEVKPVEKSKVKPIVRRKL